MEYSVFTESAISDSYIYNMFNTSGEVQTKLIKSLQSGMLVPPEYLESQLLQIEKVRFSPLFQKIVDAYKRGFIRLLYVENIKLTRSIPFVIHKEQNRVVATIFINSFGKINIDVKSCDIDAKNLYVLMESAYIGIHIQQNNGRIIKRSTLLMKLCNDVYTSMVMRILNRDYALSLDVALHDKVSFCVSKFFIERVWECENVDITVKYATTTTTEQRGDILTPLNDFYNEYGVLGIPELFNILKSMSPRMDKASVRFFVERYINTYGGASIMSIDYLPYMFFVISNILVGGFLVNQASLNDIIKNTKDIKKYYVELMKLV